MSSPLPDPPRSSVLPPVPVAPLRPGQPPLAILVDYDGTIARTDVSDQLMAEFVTADWESHVADYDAGRTGSRRLMAWEVGMITADPDALRAKAAAQPHDPDFRPFAERALAAGIPVEVVSDGFGFFIEPALAALGVGQLPVVTAATTFGPDGARIEFPTATPTASCAARASGTGCWRTRRPGGRWRSSATGRRTATPPATATSCSPRSRWSRSASPRTGRTPLVGVLEDRRMASRRPRGVRGRSVDPARAAPSPVVLWRGGLGPGSLRPGVAKP